MCLVNDEREDMTVYHSIIDALAQNDVQTAATLLNALEDPHKNAKEALYLKGVLFLKRQDPQQAALALEAAIKAGVQTSEAYTNFGLALRQLGQIEQAVQAYRFALSVNPQNATAHNNMGNILLQLGRVKDAEKAYRHAIKLNDTYSDAYKNIADLYRKEQAFSQAHRCLEAGLARVADQTPLLLSQVHLYCDQKNYHDAERQCQILLGRVPFSGLAHGLMGRIQHHLGHEDRALTYFETALKQQPHDLMITGYVVHLYLQTNRLELALEVATETCAHHRHHPLAHRHLAQVYKEQGSLDEALKSLETALSLAPEDAAIHLEYAFCLILAGQLDAGFKAYEWRLKSGERKIPTFACPAWDGQASLKGKIIVVYSEQGMGANIQYARYFTQLKARGALVHVETYPPLVGLFQTIEGVDHVYCQQKDRPEQADFYASLLSMPFLCQTTAQSLPYQVPYVQADPEKTAIWRTRLQHKKKKSVALVWQGNADFAGDGKRSMALSHLMPILQHRDLQCFSAQVGFGRDQLALLPDAVSCPDCGGAIQDFTDTAALYAAVDLLITTDTSAPHLAGALGVPVWVMLPYVPDWRYQMGRADMPWYPTMRLFRQTQRGDWGSVVRQIEQALPDFLSA